MRRGRLAVAAIALALSSAAPRVAASDDFVCTEVLGVSVRLTKCAS